MIQLLADQATPGAEVRIGALLTLGSRAQLAGEIERALLRAGSVVVRTRVRARGQLLPIARAGAVVLLEGDEHTPLLLTTADGLNSESYVLTGETAESIVKKLRHLNVVPNGEANHAG